MAAAAAAAGAADPSKIHLFFQEASVTRLWRVFPRRFFFHQYGRFGNTKPQSSLMESVASVSGKKRRPGGAQGEGGPISESRDMDAGVIMGANKPVAMLLFSRTWRVLGGVACQSPPRATWALRSTA